MKRKNNKISEKIKDLCFVQVKVVGSGPRAFKGLILISALYWAHQ